MARETGKAQGKAQAKLAAKARLETQSHAQGGALPNLRSTGQGVAAIGILLDGSAYRSVRMGGGGGPGDRLSLYRKAAAQAGVTPMYYALGRMKLAGGTATGLRLRSGKYEQIRTRLPRVIHNRAMPSTGAEARSLKRLTRLAVVFNPRNRYSKYRMYTLLREPFGAHLPETRAYSGKTLRSMMRRHGYVFAKPQRGSVGLGIVCARRMASGRWDVRLASGKRTQASFEQAAEMMARIAGGKAYIVQQGIELARWKGRPFDFRVTVQRGGNGDWQVTGTYGKAASSGRRVTNLARGGTAKRASTMLAAAFPRPREVLAAIERLALEIAQYAGRRMPGLADVGLDIGVNAAGVPYLIELNCRDQRYGFAKAGMRRTYYRTHENPIQYAKFLAERGHGIM